ncbi:hypothetical protein ETD83_27060 [Actinomadura soli]|uniref:WD40 repeat protein n=1 Tax=Actinomadura soli TaxID=2508997 RepID=A0A5C4J7K8_9ACTN|nr:hypothetical protein [Actinomadura soli]TMQ92517.1 hypothetical protein ETD83_27060 [Actinomadura soli]
MDGRRENPPWRGLIPIAVAAGVALFVGGGMDVVHRHQRAAEKEHEAAPAAESRNTEPRFVVGVAASGTALIVRDVRSGADVGLPVAAPQGRRFQRVAALKDGSYVVASYADRVVTFHRLTLQDNGRPKDLKDIPKATVSGVSTSWSDLAVSPDGDRIAYVTYQRARSRVDVVTAATGVHRVWTTKLPARVGSLSWSGTTLSFVWSPVVRSAGAKLVESKHQLRTLDTDGATGDLRLSKAVLTLPKGGTTAILSRDGKTVFAGIVENSQMSVQALSVAGAPTKVLWRQRVKDELTSLDTAHTGKALLATAGDLYTADVAVPGQDLADAAW